MVASELEHPHRMFVSKDNASLVVVLLGIELARLNQSLLLFVSPREDVPVQRSRCANKNEVPDSEPVPEVEARAIPVQLRTDDRSEALMYARVRLTLRASVTHEGYSHSRCLSARHKPRHA